jgi:hypothetical protein
MTVGRLDDRLRVPTITHTQAHQPDAALQRRIANELLRPYLLAQLLLRNHMVAMLQEIEEYLKDLGGESQASTGPAQGIETGIERTVSEDVGHVTSAGR